jgi:hypothetical protein
MKECNNLKNKWCRGIEQVADFGNPEAFGLAVSMVIDIETYAKGYGLRLGFNRAQAKDLGGKMIWLNYCPFCGVDVSKRTSK